MSLPALREYLIVNSIRYSSSLRYDRLLDLSHTRSPFADQSDPRVSKGDSCLETTEDPSDDLSPEHTLLPAIVLDQLQGRFLILLQL